MCSLYLLTKKYSFCINLTPTTYATIDTTIICHVYKPDFVVCVRISATGSWDLFAIKSAAVFRLVFFQVNENNSLLDVDDNADDYNATAADDDDYNDDDDDDG